MVEIGGAASPMRDSFRELLGSIAVYRASLGKDTLSGEWLALQHHQGLWHWSQAVSYLDEVGGSNAITDDEFDEIMAASRGWAQDTFDTFTGWMSGSVSDAVLAFQGRAIIEGIGRPKTLEIGSQWG